jgi:hypothetical protein
VFARVMSWLALLALGGCASIDPAQFRTLERGPAAGKPGWRGLPVADGQIIVTEKPSPMALLISLTAERFEPYVHAGLIVFDDGQPYVYESFGMLMPHWGGRPTRGMRGGVRRVRLEAFLRRGGITAVYEPAAPVDRKALLAFARDALGRRVRFDDVFDGRDPQKMYCVEFVARSLQAASPAPLEAVPMSRNASLRVLLDWLEIRAQDLWLAGALLDDERRVLLMDPRRSRDRIEQYFARKRELHRRFTADRRLGAVFEWRRGLRLRPRVGEYLFAPDTGEDAARLADRLLGTVADRASLAGTRQR